MLWTPQKGRNRTISNGGIVGSATLGTNLPASATTLLDGAVTELISAAANDQDSWGISINLNAGAAPSAAVVSGCVDILIGGATDDVLVPALICGNAGRVFGYSYFFPLHIPAGKRIAGTHANVVASKAMNCLVTLHGGSPPPWKVGRKVTAIGTQANNVKGQAITVSSSGAAATATQLTASTAEDYFALFPGIQVEDSTMTVGYLNVGIGVGAATEDRIGTWIFGTSAGEEVVGPVPHFPVFQDVLAGSRITMLASFSAAADAAYDGLVYAVS